MQSSKHIHINQAMLESIIKKSVSKVLNEISTERKYDAFDKADSLGRLKQASYFQKMADGDMEAKYKVNDYIYHVNRDYITYRTRPGYRAVLYSDGNIALYTEPTGRLEFDSTWGNGYGAEKRMRTTNRQAAKAITSWWQDWGDKSHYPELTDLHTIFTQDEYDW